MDSINKYKYIKMKTFKITIPKDLRLGQVLFNFLSWIQTYENVPLEGSMADPFYLSDDRMIELWHRYLHHIHAYDRKQKQEEE